MNSQEQDKRLQALIVINQQVALARLQKWLHRRKRGTVIDNNNWLRKITSFIKEHKN